MPTKICRYKMSLLVFISVVITQMACFCGIYFYWNFVKNKQIVPYTKILEKIPQGIIILDSALNLFFVNECIKKIFLPMELSDDFLEQLKQKAKEEGLKQSLLKIGLVDYHVQKWKEEGFTIFAFELSEQKKIHQVGKDFVANASHELRTPITIIKGFAETIKDLPQISDVMLHDFTDKILRSCQRMDSLVKNLLLLADLDHSKRMSFRESDLLALMESVSFTILSIHPETCIEILTSDEDITLSFDPDMLEQAFLNLLENAVKYSPKSAEITIIVEKKLEEIVVKIQDKGVGIPEEHLPYIFQRFYRVNQDRSRKLGGAGLGLSIVQAIIEKHQGKIKAQSKIQEGTTFEIVFEK